MSALKECPICMDDKPDVEVLEHVESHGDISGHAACGACRSALPAQNTCPFCFETLTSNSFAEFLEEFVQNWARNHKHHDVAAAVLEQWQLFEMSATNPASVRRVLHQVATHPRVVQCLLRSNEAISWKRDAAGVVFRIHGAVADGEIQVPDDLRKGLQDSVEQIMMPFEHPQSVHPPLPAHFHGALYTQAVVAVMSAQTSGSSTTTLCELARRVGYAIATVASTLPAQWRVEVKQRMHAAYVREVSSLVWDILGEDAVLQTFYS
eukprot:GFYU01013872.1.p1 GENE.GFYU01013872.1~~GFYU01013872.1.p1  ORF type:complete len:265 (-),score=31.82 GFYU01013872.1:67-861(-)